MDQLYMQNLLQEIKSTLVRIETVLDALGKETDDHENRIRSLESKVVYYSGGLGLAGMVAGYVLPKIIK